MDPVPDAHRHGWSVDRFQFVADRPMVLQRCGCGAERAVRAWDRSWAPPAAWRLVGGGMPQLAGRLMHPVPPDALAILREPQRVADAINVDAWSDVACPWCYIGKRNLEAGIAAFGGPVEVEYHSFELAPDTPVDFDGSEIDYLMQIKGITREQAEAMHERVAGIAADVGLRYDFASVKHTRTVKAHQLMHYAKARGLQEEAAERLFGAYFVEGRHIGRDESLAALAAEIGLDEADVLRALRGDEHLADVRADQQQAIAYGIRGVPFYVLDGRYGLSGAQPAGTFAAALRAVAEERSGVSR
jgi:predicted DsbA family dithiol-disulfide isomerase